MATKACCIKLQQGIKISGEEMCAVIDEIMNGEATQSQIGAFLALLKFEFIDGQVLAAAAKAMRAHALPCVADETVDIVGTGGDGHDTFNVSTCAAVVIAAVGCKVMKHGSRSNASKCGSADILEAAGARLNVNGNQATRVLAKTGFCFLFAQKFHPCMKNVAGARKEIGIRSVFNILGPLINPCQSKYLLTGVYDKQLGQLYADTLVELGIYSAMVCHSAEGLDEISPAGITHCWIVKNGNVTTRDISAADFGLPVHDLAEVKGGEPKESLKIFKEVLTGKAGPCLDFVLMNAAAALWVAEKCNDFKEGVAMCRAALEAGKGTQVLEAYIKESNDVFGNKTILEQIEEHRTQVINEEKKKISTFDLALSGLSQAVPPLIDILDRIKQTKGTIALAAEIKRASPSKGIINADIDPAQQARQYAEGGASCISVLCEEKWFKGSINDLAAVRKAIDDLPNRPAVLLKDFVVDEWQLVQGRIAGADTALLIVAMLGEKRLPSLMAASRKLGMEPLVEVANDEEMRIAIDAGAKLIGINNRNLHTFDVNNNKTCDVIGTLNQKEKASVTLVALSGIQTREDVLAFQRAGAVAVLVGESLMRSDDPAKMIGELIGAGASSPTKKQKTKAED